MKVNEMKGIRIEQNCKVKKSIKKERKENFKEEKERKIQEMNERNAKSVLNNRPSMIQGIIENVTE